MAWRGVSGRIPAAAAGLVFAFTGQGASAGFTTIEAPRATELGHREILEGVYGGTFTPSGANFILGGAGSTLSAIRVDDFGFGTGLNLVTGNPGGVIDTEWTDGIASADAKAVYAAYAQEFGYFTDTSGGFQPLFQVFGTGFNLIGEGEMDFGGQMWRWGRNGQEGAQSSRDADNLDLADHMVTYKLIDSSRGGEFSARWLLFWEDRNGDPSDWDYNDLVVEISASATIIPLPTGAALGAAGLGLIVFTRRRR